jgi:hypothetical protein
MSFEQIGVSTSADVVKAIGNYPTPKNTRDARAFLGLASFQIKIDLTMLRQQIL